MIFDTIKNLRMYSNLHAGFEIVADYIEQTNLAELENGKHLLPDEIFISVNEYHTKSVEETFVESHNKYIDIQLITKGEEAIGYCPVEQCVVEEVLEDKDLVKLDGDVSKIALTTGMFAIFFPEDGHMPGLHLQEPSEVKKIVFKIPV